MTRPTHRIPISILTGFLGSGKTTLLARLLAHPSMARTAVLVNEFGAVGIDDLLLRTVTENVVLLESGCICCTIGDDLTKRLLELLAHRELGAVPPFERAIVETTGLADPAPLLQGFMREPLASAPFRMAAVITTVDATNAARHLDEHVESVKQVALADRLLVTKSDLAHAEAIAQVRLRLCEINPTACLHSIANGVIDPELILDAGLWNARTGRVDIGRWLNTRALDDAAVARRERGFATGGAMASTQMRHDTRIETFCIVWDEPMQFDQFADAVESLLGTYGDDLLRIKGILAVKGSSAPILVNGVQRTFYPPVRLPSWPSDDHRPRVVFITRAIPRAVVESELMRWLTPRRSTV